MKHILGTNFLLKVYAATVHILHIILYLKGFQDEPSDELDPPQ